MNEGMYQIEYVRSMQCNYVRFLLPEKPEERRFQYCMLGRGGMKGLLGCSLRYLDGSAYLYYDITSKQNVAQMFQRTTISRKWLVDFVDSIKQVQQSLERFLLLDNNVLWHPEHIFQDLEKNEFSYIYIPYYSGENQFIMLMSFLVEHIDYEDEKLVECVYRMYEQYERNGDIYLQEQIFRDVKLLESNEGYHEEGFENEELAKEEAKNSETKKAEMKRVENKRFETKRIEIKKEEVKKELQGNTTSLEDAQEETGVEKKGLFSLFKGLGGEKEKEIRDSYRETMHRKIQGFVVAEDTIYEDEDYGRTVFLDASLEQKETIHRVYSADGNILANIQNNALLIGKVKDKTDIYLEDPSVSRMHAKIYKKKNDVILEDLNSTNGTFVNGNQMQPYEKIVLEPGDEIRCGNQAMFYR